MSREVLLDTPVWLWFVGGSKRLKPATRRRIERAEGPWLSPISVWEATMLAHRGRIVVDRAPRVWALDAVEAVGAREAPLTSAVAATAALLDLPRPDPADALIAATAMTLGFTLITADEGLLALRGLASVEA